MFQIIYDFFFIIVIQNPRSTFFFFWDILYVLIINPIQDLSTLKSLRHRVSLK